MPESINWQAVGLAAGALLAVFGVGRWVQKINQGEADFRKFVEEIRGEIKEILRRLPPTPTGVAPGSPLQLTAYGKKMAAVMDADAWAEALVPTLREDLGDASAAEVDMFSRQYVRGNMPNDRRVAKCMYELGVDEDNALKVLQVVLRDALFKDLGLSTAALD